MSTGPQLEDGFVRIANEIWNEVIRRDFTKRQQNILLFIWRLSYGCNKKTAYIPRLKDFEICGVGQQNIRQELKFLSNCNVIIWDEKKNIYTVNKHIDQWQISPVKGWDEGRFREILRQNLDEKKQENFSKQEVSNKKTSQNEKKYGEKTSRNKKFSAKKVVITSQNKKFLQSLKTDKLLKTRSSDFLKQEVSNDDIPCGSKGEAVPKDIIKDNTTTTTTTTTRDADEFSFGKVFEAYQKNFTNGRITEFDVDEFQFLYDDFGGEWLLEAMREAYRQGPDKRNLAYVRGILRGYKERGGPNVGRDDEILATNRSHSATAKSRLEKRNEELIRMIREAEEEEKEAMEREQERSFEVIHDYPERLSRL